jgi:hypothetical protein
MPKPPSLMRPIIREKEQERAAQLAFSPGEVEAFVKHQVQT